MFGITLKHTEIRNKKLKDRQIEITTYNEKKTKKVNILRNLQDNINL